MYPVARTVLLPYALFYETLLLRLRRVSAEVCIESSMLHIDKVYSVVRCSSVLLKLFDRLDAVPVVYPVVCAVLPNFSPIFEIRLTKRVR